MLRKQESAPVPGAKQTTQRTDAQQESALKPSFKEYLDKNNEKMTEEANQLLQRKNAHHLYPPSVEDYLVDFEEVGGGGVDVQEINAFTEEAYTSVPLYDYLISKGVIAGPMDTMPQ
jgi:hypothetical protein